MIIYKSINLIETTDSYYGHDEEQIVIFKTLREAELHCCNSFISFISELLVSDDRTIEWHNKNKSVYLGGNYCLISKNSNLLLLIIKINNHINDSNYKEAVSLISSETFNNNSFRIEQEELQDYLEKPVTLNSKDLSDRLKQLVFDQ